ncbi:hypothetical protein [Nonomuraea polychroma]|uniref:hypothetical protein n=1 Tax=Nonomuraea polychroma TaxID=46176 RepID=UPI0019D4CC25|nr:hypothetical protein [Nonomuraea polychroma]
MTAQPPEDPHAEVIRRLNEAGTTVLLVEQNVRLGLALATHGVVMEGGRVRLAGTAAAVRDNPEIASLYLGGETRWTSESPPPSRTGRPGSPPTA